MQFQKNSSIRKSGTLIRLLIKIIAVFLLLSFLVVLADKIEFPVPNKKIEKKIPNENFKVVK